MKRRCFLLTSFCCLAAAASSAQIANSTTLQTGANFNIDGTGQAKLFKTSNTTGASGTGHFAMTQNNLNRWALGTANVENGTNLQGSDFALYSYNNDGGFRARYLTVKRNNGFMGINTTVPTAQLHVSSAPQIPLAKFTYSNVAESNAFLRFNNSTIKDGSFVPNITGRAYSPGRSYGIGITGEAEDVIPPSNEPGAAGVVLDGRSTSGRLLNANVLTICSSAIPLVTVKANGSMGIGTSNPGTSKLAVDGTIAARKVKVTQASPWPDYVFEHDYQLPPLQTVETFIKENKHLPGVPSATEITENGQDLGEMNTVLLEKIEELTLHMIRMEKELLGVKAANRELSRQVATMQAKQ